MRLRMKKKYMRWLLCKLGKNGPNLGEWHNTQSKVNKVSFDHAQRQSRHSDKDKEKDKDNIAILQEADKTALNGF